MNYYIDVIKTQKNNAAKKAPADISAICSKMGMTAINMPDIPYEKSPVYQKLWMMTVWSRYLMKISMTLKKGDTLLYQHPMYGTRLLSVLIPKLKKKGVRLVSLIHDLNIIRGAEELKNVKNSSVSLQDSVILNEFDKIICHNDRMKTFLINQGFDKDKLVCLEIFDYLCDTPVSETVNNTNHINCVIAGNLLPEKSNYIYELTRVLSDKADVKLYLYGNGYDEKKATISDNIKYCGSVDPSELPSIIADYDYGIVWDGKECSTCSGHTGEYLKYNNPHKTSLYLASGIPVIVWKEAAIADFVLKNEAGIVIDDLNDLATVLKNIDENQYLKMKQNAVAISEKLRNGLYFIQAFKKALAE